MAHDRLRENERIRDRRARQPARPSRAPASLEALLGIPRSALLRRLDQPQAAGEIARALGYTASAISFHLRGLEASGLVSRHRRGRSVIVHRTARGAQLLALYRG